MYDTYRHPFPAPLSLFMSCVRCSNATTQIRAVHYPMQNALLLKQDKRLQQTSQDLIRV
jgi:hypothetical protein